MKKFLIVSAIIFGSGLLFFASTGSVSATIAAPIGLTPLDGTSILSNPNNVTLEWWKVFDAEWYDYYVEGPNGQEFLKNNDKYTDTTITFEALQLGTYKWEVRACKAGAIPPINECSDWSEKPSFNIISPVPTLVSPISGQSVDTLTPNLNWIAAEGETPQCYEVEIVNLWSSKTADTSIEVPTGKLNDGQSYSWRARESPQTCDIAMNKTWSGWETFTVQLAAPRPGPGPGPGPGPAPVSGPRTGCPTAGLVPCGTTGCPCQFCDFFVMVNGIIRFVMTTLVPIIAVLMLVIGGVLFLFAGAKPSTLNQAKGIITSVIIGILIIFGAWVIVNTLLNMSGIIDSPSVLRWYEITCPTQ